MANKSGLLFAVAGLALCAGLAWIALSPLEKPADADASPRAPLAERATAPSYAIEASEAARDATRALDVLAPIEAARTDVASTPPFDTDRAIWVEGRVIFPPGTPADERAEVVAHYGRDKSKQPHRARVAADGTFRVAFPAGTDVGRLELRARYVFLSDRLRLTFEGPLRPLVLEPELGGCVHAVFVLPVGSEGQRSEFVGTTLSASADYMYSSGTSMRPTRSAEVEDPAYVDIGGVVSGIALTISGEPQTFAAFKIRGVRVEPGAVTALEIRLEHGVSLSGQVVDEREQPISGATFQLSVVNGNETTKAERDTPTGPDGRFALHGIRAGKITLTATAPGYLATRVKLEPPADGSAQDDIQVSMKRGRSILGRVQWPDGSAAPGATLVLALVETEDVDVQWDDLGWSDTPHYAANADGAFEISGLTAGPFVLVARATRAKDASATGSARLDSVSSDGEPLVVTLEEGHELRGRVVDDTGHAVERFAVSALPSSSDRQWNPIDDSVTGRSLGGDGRFVVLGLHTGSWMITVRAGGTFARSEVSVPGDGAAFEILLPRPASISGAVLDSDGKAVRGARVSYTPGQGFGTDSELRVISAPTGADGRFELGTVSAGPAMLDAAHYRWAPSETERVDVPVGATISNVVMKLRASGRLTGEVRDANGQVDAARRIITRGARGDGKTYAYAESDALGRFEFDGLPAGQYALATQANTAEREAARGEDGQADPTTLQDAIKRAQATVVAGQTTHVVLGGKARAPVRVNGRVTCGTLGVGGMRIVARGSERAGEWRSRTSTRTDEAGRYELELDEPGRFIFNLGDSSRGSTFWQSVAIPEQAQVSFDFELPGARIAGRVLMADGEPASGVVVELQSKSLAESAAGSLQTGYSGTTTGGDGRFAFEYLLPGTYDVRTSEPGIEESARYGRASADELILAWNASIEDLELKLELAAHLEVEVVNRSGERIPGADVFMFDESGASIEDSSGTATNSAGRKRIGGLPARSRMVFARKGSLASAVSAPVRLRAGETEQVKLELRQGTMLYVIFENSDPSGPRFASVRDERGIDHSAMSSSPAAAPPTMPGMHGFSVGPLPPGRYRVTPQDKEFEKHGVDVVVAGEEVQQVKLTLRK